MTSLHPGIPARIRSDYLKRAKQNSVLFFTADQRLRITTRQTKQKQTRNKKKRRENNLIIFWQRLLLIELFCKQSYLFAKNKSLRARFLCTFPRCVLFLWQQKNVIGRINRLTSPPGISDNQILSLLFISLVKFAICAADSTCPRTRAFHIFTSVIN